MNIIELTKNEKKLLKAIIETWQQEGCPNVTAWSWVIDERKDSDTYSFVKATTKEIELGNKLINEAVKGLEQKLNIKIY